MKEILFPGSLQLELSAKQRKAGRRWGQLTEGALEPLDTWEPSENHNIPRPTDPTYSYQGNAR